MERFLEIFLISILPKEWALNQNVFIRSFEGKQDLQRSLPKKVKVLSNWHEPVGLIVLQDQDSSDCSTLKNKLMQIIQSNGEIPYLIRIVCRELESWYIGDMEAIKKAYPKFKSEKYINQAKFRNPDILNAADELSKLLPEFQKVTSASKIAQHINIETNKSDSFNQFVIGFNRFILHSK